jgi:hypothetical protein
MLKSYEAIYDHGKIEWLSEFPDVEQARVIVTVLPQQYIYSEKPKHRRPPEKLKGTAQIVGDMVSSSFSADEWDVMTERTAQQINGNPEAFK